MVTDHKLLGMCSKLDLGESTIILSSSTVQVSCCLCMKPNGMTGDHKEWLEQGRLEQRECWFDLDNHCSESRLGSMLL
jgi:hypothetical protein